MKTVALISYWFPPDVGACPNRMGDMAEELPKHGFATAVLVRRGWRADGQCASPRLSQPVGRGLGAVDALRWLRRCRPHVAVVTVPPWHELWRAWVACRLLRIPTVLDVRDPWALVDAQLRAGQRLIGAKTALYAAAERVMCCHSTAVVVNSYGLKQHLAQLDHRVGGPIWYVPNAHKQNADVAPSPALRRTLGLDDRYLVLYAGAVGAAQGIERVLASLAPHADALKETGVAFAFLGGGEATSAKLSLESAKRGLGGVAFFHPSMPRHEAMAAMADANAGLIALAEGFDYAMPSKVFDALGLGKPVLAHVPPTSTAAWFVSAYGVGVPFYRPDQVLPAIHAVMEQGAAMGDAGRRLVAEEYNRAATVGRLAAHLHSLVEQGHP